MAGSATTAPGLDGIDFALVRYDTDGSLDPTFGTGGKVVTDFIAPCSGFCLPGETATALVVQGDGKLVAAGMTTARADEAFALARYEGGNASTTSTTSTTTTVTTTTRPRLMPEECGDGIDNDGDALVDCKDPDCETSPQCSLGCPVGPTPDAVRCRTMALARPVGDTTPTGKLRDRLLKLSGRIDTLQVGADSSCRAGKTFRARRALVVESHAIVTLRRRLGTLPLSDPEAESRRQLRKALRLLNQDVHGLTRALHCPSTRG